MKKAVFLLLSILLCVPTFSMHVKEESGSAYISFELSADHPLLKQLQAYAENPGEYEEAEFALLFEQLVPFAIAYEENVPVFFEITSSEDNHAFNACMKSSYGINIYK